MNHVTVALTLLLAARAGIESHYTSARTYDRDAFRFRPPSDEQLAHMRSLMSAMVKALKPGEPPAPLVKQAKDAGFDLVSATDAAGEIWILRESGAKREGGGLYALRAKGGPLCIQAPHTYYDEGTGEIAMQLFAKLGASCLFTDTVHRYSKSDSPEENPADVAHSPRTMFAAANQGLFDAVRWAIVQPHGFGDRKDLPAGAKAVVSDGTPSRPATDPAPRLRAALKAQLGGGVLLYGEDAQVLGATTNVEGKVARRAGAVFLHIEMSAPTRRALSRDATPLATALGETLRAHR